MNPKWIFTYPIVCTFEFSLQSSPVYRWLYKIWLFVGTPDVVLSGVRAEVNIKVIPIGNGKFRCSYIPILPGAYLLHITWNGRQLRGSPYKVNVIGAFYPNRVAVSGVGGAILGREMNVGIDTRKAGPGLFVEIWVHLAPVKSCCRFI